MIRSLVYLTATLAAIVSSTISIVSFNAGRSPVWSLLAGVCTILAIAMLAEAVELMLRCANFNGPACADCGASGGTLFYCTAPDCANRLCTGCANKPGHQGYCAECEDKWQRNHKPRHTCACGKGAACCNA